jgi:hypothetical protein
MGTWLAERSWLVPVLLRREAPSRWLGPKRPAWGSGIVVGGLLLG